jgi:hypothetical protein
VENCLKDCVLVEALKFARLVNESGTRRVRDWRAGRRMFFEAVRTPRLMADMVTINQRTGNRQQKLSTQEERVYDVEDNC